MTAQQTVDVVSPIFARAGSAWYFTPETVAVGKALGLGGTRFYFLGRGGVLGEVDWRVVHSAFGYFKPALIEQMWTTARERCDVATATVAHLGACADFGRRTLAGTEGLEAFCEAAARVVDAAASDPAGLTLFAGYAGQPIPEDLPARTAHYVAVLRELRGSAHLLAVVAAGVPTPTAHAIRRPDDLRAFGWEEAEVPVPTDDDRRRLGDADRLTDAIVSRLYETLSQGETEALVAGAQAIAAAIAASR